MRKKLGADFPIGIKLNSADFQKGGFTEEESMEVIQLFSKRRNRSDRDFRWKLRGSSHDGEAQKEKAP